MLSGARCPTNLGAAGAARPEGAAPVLPWPRFRLCLPLAGLVFTEPCCGRGSSDRLPQRRGRLAQGATGLLRFRSLAHCCRIFTCSPGASTTAVRPIATSSCKAATCHRSAHATNGRSKQQEGRRQRQRQRHRQRQRQRQRQQQRPGWLTVRAVPVPLPCAAAGSSTEPGLMALPRYTPSLKPSFDAKSSDGGLAA